MKVLLIGANGQLGSDIVKVFQGKNDIELFPLTHKDIEVTDFQSVKKSVALYGPEFIINTAAFHNVDRCEEEVESAFKVNAFAQVNLCKICNEKDITYVFFSTDYLFNGKKDVPYTEEDCPKPINIYGISKLAGELIIQYMLEKYYIVRVSGLYGATGPSGKKWNFVDLMLAKAKQGEKIRVVDDQRLTPTSTSDVANKLYELIHVPEYGIYHMTNEGDCTWYEFAQCVFKIADLNPNLEPCKTGSFGNKAKRPRYSVLGNYALRSLGIEMKHWKKAVRQYLIGKNRTTRGL
ncbi:MAG TPA: dTDP-4-dehydrorhamnose reductase [bacterium (Candidatus Stahlbacteria)]|nr:dTDP-4-dehydrorhamnose reductase [Candidatus Stahlbacteria bacterium]